MWPRGVRRGALACRNNPATSYTSQVGSCQCCGVRARHLQLSHGSGANLAAPTRRLIAKNPNPRRASCDAADRQHSDRLTGPFRWPYSCMARCVRHTSLLCSQITRPPSRRSLALLPERDTAVPPRSRPPAPGCTARRPHEASLGTPLSSSRKAHSSRRRIDR